MERHLLTKWAHNRQRAPAQPDDPPCGDGRLPAPASWRYTERMITPPPRDPRVFSWINSTPVALARLVEVGVRLHALAPCWYDADLCSDSVIGVADHKTTALAQATALPLWPVVNARAKDGALGSPEIVTALAARLAQLAIDGAFTGLTPDFERLAPTPTARAAFTSFVSQLVRKLHRAHIKLAVYVPRPNHSSNIAYDRATLCQLVDLLLICGYDESWSTSPPGPMATAAGFDSIIALCKNIGRDGNAVPVLGAIGWEWPAGGGPAHTITSASRSIAATGSGEDGTTGTDGSTAYWESATDLSKRWDAVKTSRVPWAALFSMGYEPSAFWDFSGPGN